MEWLLGFIQGDACFYINIVKSTKLKLGESVQLTFKITQHIRDLDLMKKIEEYLECGKIYIRKTQACDYTVVSKIENLFDKLNFNYLLGLKLLDYKDFYYVYQLIKDKKHLTREGLLEIKNIKENMSKRREKE